jgi:hypothetical protein
LGALLTFVLAVATAQDLKPSVWHDKELYSLFVLSVVPLYFTKVFEIGAACAVLKRRYRLQKYVNYLRYALLAQAIVGGSNLFIDYNHFPDNLPFTVLTTAFAVLWYLYFTGSLRVDWVLAHGDREWDHEAFRASKGTPRTLK